MVARSISIAIAYPIFFPHQIVNTSSSRQQQHFPCGSRCLRAVLKPTRAAHLPSKARELVVWAMRVGLYWTDGSCREKQLSVTSLAPAHNPIHSFIHSSNRLQFLITNITKKRKNTLSGYNLSERICPRTRCTNRNQPCPVLSVLNRFWLLV